MVNEQSYLLSNRHVFTFVGRALVFKDPGTGAAWATTLLLMLPKGRLVTKASRDYPGRSDTAETINRCTDAWMCCSSQYRKWHVWETGYCSLQSNIKTKCFNRRHLRLRAAPETVARPQSLDSECSHRQKWYFSTGVQDCGSL